MEQYQVMQMPAWHVCEWLVIDVYDNSDFDMFDIEGEARDFAELLNDNTEYQQ